MSKYRFRSLVVAAALSAAMAGSAAADVVWNFSSIAGTQGALANSNLGGTYTFNQSGLWVQATAVVSNPNWANSTCTGAANATASDPCLFNKVTNGDPIETGLGLTPNANNEIFNPAGIALNVTPGQHFSSIEIGSVQSGESWAVAGCSASYSLCTVLDQGLGAGSGSTVTVSNLVTTPYATYIVYVPCANSSSCGNGTTDSSNNLVLMSATTVPEPGTLAFMAAGLFGLGWMIRRRRAN